MKAPSPRERENCPRCGEPIAFLWGEPYCDGCNWRRGQPTEDAHGD